MMESWVSSRLSISIFHYSTIPLRVRLVFSPGLPYTYYITRK